MDSHVPGLRSLSTRSLTRPGNVQFCRLHSWHVPRVLSFILYSYCTFSMFKYTDICRRVAVTCRTQCSDVLRGFVALEQEAAPLGLHECTLWCLHDRTVLVPHFSEHVFVVKWLMTKITNKSQESSFPLAVTYSVKTRQVRKPCLCLHFFPSHRLLFKSPLLLWWLRMESILGKIKKWVNFLVHTKPGPLQCHPG